MKCPSGVLVNMHAAAFPILPSAGSTSTVRPQAMSSQQSGALEASAMQSLDSGAGFRHCRAEGYDRRSFKGMRPDAHGIARATEGRPLNIHQ